jgi:hypothetical protein
MWESGANTRVDHRHDYPRAIDARGMKRSRSVHRIVQRVGIRFGFRDFLNIRGGQRARNRMEYSEYRWALRVPSGLATYPRSGEPAPRGPYAAFPP